MHLKALKVSNQEMYEHVDPKLLVHKVRENDDPLHCLGFALTPRFYDKTYLSTKAPDGIPRKPPNLNKEVTVGVIDAFKRISENEEETKMLRAQNSRFHMKKCLYVRLEDQIDVVAIAIIDWWSTYGSETPKLSEIAKKVLSQLSGTNSNAIFALPGHGSTSPVGRKSNAIFALPGHGSTSPVGRKSNAIFALYGHGSTSPVGCKSNAIFALPGHESTSSVGRKSNAIFTLPGHGSASSIGLYYTGSAFIIINPSHYPFVKNEREWYLANASVTPTIENVFFLRGLYRLATGNQASEHNHPTHVRGCCLR
uniref:Uncharacterized protein n=1 Tax=Tanacetum cinerariifolium TaxID=118510 RepID=A0A6L2NAS4_TANCI|nr:hypothetical protein [Tanacetum cinerariifolium]